MSASTAGADNRAGDGPDNQAGDGPDDQAGAGPDADDATGFLADLRTQLGETGSATEARDPVNAYAIRVWCDAMSEANPYFTDPEAAAAGPHRGLVAPPGMLNVWTMPGLVMGQQPMRGVEPQSKVLGKLDAAGFVGVVATNSDQEYRRYLRPGDVLTARTRLDDVSELKRTGLGEGHFVTTRATYTDQDGEEVGSLFFRILKFRPGTGKAAPPPNSDGSPAAAAPPNDGVAAAAPPTTPRTGSNRPGPIVSVGDSLPTEAIALTPRLVVSSALATRDFQDVHHDRDAAVTKGSKDIFMNILSSTGICNRWIGDWAGDDAVFQNVRIRLGAPNYPYDTMTMSGSVTAVEPTDGGVAVTVGFVGANAIGNHAMGTADLVLPHESA